MNRIAVLRGLAALGAEEILAAMKRHLDPAKISYVQAGDFAKGEAAPGAAATPK
ncbi:MAG TPA: hypothetical protein VFE44_06690 [Thermoanaerobaculia bacterium]|nr:hypothetical protein [Thermoanaerobaculia bacterium]